MGENLKKSILSIGKILLLMLLVLAFSTVTLLPVPVVTTTNPTTTVYLDPPTINATEADVNTTITVNLMIRGAPDMNGWGAGMIFNATLLNCTGFKQGEFLKNLGSTLWQPGPINNTAGKIGGTACVLTSSGVYASGNGKLAYLTFKVKAPGVSDLHLQNVIGGKDTADVPLNIIDVYTVVVGTIPNTVVIFSNSTGSTGWYGSGFYAHAFNPTLKELSFNVTGPKPGFSNVTIPKTLLPPSPTGWKVLIDGDLVNRTVTENSTHTSIYFTYSEGIHKIRITTRMSSTISLALSLTSIHLGENITISGNVTAEDLTVRPNVNATISYRPSGGTWSTLHEMETGSNGNYTYLWKPKAGGTYEFMASWEGDNETLEDKSNVETLSVRAFYFFIVEGLEVGIETNSTPILASAFNFSQPLKQISFNVTTPYGIIGFSNVTIPKALLPPSPTGWKVLINGTLLSAEEIIVTENATHTSIYFTYSKGFNIVATTNRMSSTILMALSSNSTDLGSSVTISGNITREDHTGRPNVNVTIQSRSIGTTTWDTIHTVETNSNSDYTYPWTPGAAGIYDVMTSWEGDNETLGNESDVQTLTVIENSTISIALSSTNITFGSSVTISGNITAEDHTGRPNVLVTIKYRLISEAFWTSAGQNQTDQDSRYTFVWKPTTPGTYEIRAMWLGDETTHNATSSVLTLAAKWTSTISIALSSTEITKGKSVTISGNITAADNNKRANDAVAILYKPSGGGWISLANVTTDSNGTYTHTWKPKTDGTYYIMAKWEGDNITFGNETEALTLTVKKAPGIPLEILAVAVVAIIVIAAIAVYFIKFRKPKGKQTVP
jgi:5-hydroxyisourate hydrolase-like protein (transthyretin family)